MDRTQPYYYQEVTHGEVDQWHDQAEAADQAIVADHVIWGVTSGFLVKEDAPPSLSVGVDGGVAYDEDGQRIVNTANILVDLAAHIPANLGDERYVAIYVEADRLDSDPRVDGDGVALNYLHEESYAVHIEDGTAGPPAQPKPAIVPNMVLLAVVHLTAGMVQILNADISQLWYNLATPDRQVGGAVAPGRRLPAEKRIAFAPAIADVVITVGANNTLDTDGGNITMGGGTVDSETGDLIKATMVNAEQPDPSIGQGFLYANPATGALRTIFKPWDIPSTTMMPGAQTTHPWVAALVDNNWAIAPTDRVNWSMLWNGAGAGVARQGVSLIAAFKVPEGSKIVRATVNLTVLAALPVGDQLRFICGVAYDAKDGSGIVVHTTKTYNRTSGGVWAAGGNSNVIAMSTTDASLIAVNGDGYTTVGNTYYVYMYMDDTAGVGNNTFVSIHSATVNTDVREASHVF